MSLSNDFMIPYFVLETFNLGPLTLHVWGAFAGLAFAAALLIALKEARRKNISEDDILNLAIIILIGGIGGARLFFVIENWGDYSKEPMRILSLNEGGLMFYGGFFGAAALVAIYIRVKKLSFWRIADTVVPSLAIGEAIGRIGCALADLHIGSITALPWGQKYIDDSIRHPIAIYMAINGLTIFIALWFLRLRLRAEGALFLFFLLWYSGSRFLLDFLRCKDLDLCDPHYFGFTPSQYISVLIFLSALAIVFVRSGSTSLTASHSLLSLAAAGLSNLSKKLIFNLPAAAIQSIEELFNRFKLNFYPAPAGLTGKIKFMEEDKKEMIEKQPESGNEIKSDHDSDSRAGAEISRNKKYWSYITILVIGLAIGAGLFSGYYERLFKQPLFSFRGKTWVSYEDPIVKFMVVNDKGCEACNTDDVVKQLKTKAIPTLSAEEVSYNSQKGKDLIGKFGIKSLPAFVFDSSVEKLGIFNQINPALVKKDNLYYLSASSIGIKPGKFLELPAVTANDRIKGPANAPIAIIEFSDFQCPYCKAESDVVKQVLAAYPDKVKFVYKHFPLTQIHPNAEFAAEAAECAGDQNKFWEMSDMLYANQDSLNKGTADQYKSEVNKYADQLKMNKKNFADCLSSNKYKSKVEADAKLAADYGISGTPAFFINDQFTGGAVTLDEFKATIDQQLKGK